MKRPSPDALSKAASWLETIEGGGREADDYRHVALWLREQSDAAALREKCRKAGVPVAKVRKRGYVK